MNVRRVHVARFSADFIASSSALLAHYQRSRDQELSRRQECPHDAMVRAREAGIEAETLFLAGRDPLEVVLLRLMARMVNAALAVTEPLTVRGDRVVRNVTRKLLRKSPLPVFLLKSRPFQAAALNHA